MSRQTITSNHQTNEDGTPAGGVTRGTGIDIEWQNGPLAHHDPETGERVEGVQNGAFVEGVIEAAIDRIHHYNTVADGRFRCRENSLAITKLEEALHWLDARTSRRTQEGKLGTHEA